MSDESELQSSQENDYMDELDEEEEFETEISQESVSENQHISIDPLEIVNVNKQLKTLDPLKRKLLLIDFMKSLPQEEYGEEVINQLNILFLDNVEPLKDEASASIFFRIVRVINAPFMLFVMSKIVGFLKADRLLPFAKSQIGVFLGANKKDRVYYKYFLTQLLTVPDVLSQNQRQSLFRKLVKYWLQLTKEEKAQNAHRGFIVSLVGQMGESGQQQTLSLIRELHTFYFNAKAGRSIALFGSVSSAKSQQKHSEVKERYKKQAADTLAKLGKSPEEVQSERLSGADVLALFDLATYLTAAHDFEQLNYPLVEVSFMYFNHLDRYPRTAFFQLRLLELLVNRICGKRFVPLQNIVLNILVQALAPAPKKGLQFNLSKYKGKLCDENEVLQYKKLYCVPTNFVLTVVYKELLFKHAVRILANYYVIAAGAVKTGQDETGFDPLSFLSLPELTGHARVQILTLQKAVQGELNAPGQFYKWQYFNYQFAFAKEANRQLARIKYAIDADTKLAHSIRANLDLKSLAEGQVEGLIQNLGVESLESAALILGKQSALLAIRQEFNGTTEGVQAAIKPILVDEEVDEVQSDLPELPEESFNEFNEEEISEDESDAMPNRPDVVKELEL